MGIKGPYPLLYNIAGDTLPPELASCRAAELVANSMLPESETPKFGVKAVLAGRNRSEATNFAVSHAMCSLLMWASRLIAMLFLRVRMPLALVNWECMAHMVLRLDHSVEITSDMRGHVLATCESETLMFSNDQLEGHTNLSDLIRALFTRVVFFKTIIWDFMDLKTCGLACKLFAALNSTMMVVPVPIDVGGGVTVTVPFIGRDVNRMLIKLPVSATPEAPLYFVEQVMMLRDTPQTEPCDFEGIYPAAAARMFAIVNILPLIKVARRTEMIAADTKRKHHPTYVSRVLVALGRKGGSGSRDTPLLRHFMRAAVYMRSPMAELQDETKDPTIRYTLAVCRPFAEPVAILADEESFGSLISDICTLIITEWTLDVQRVLSSEDHSESRVFTTACLAAIYYAWIKEDKAAEMAAFICELISTQQVCYVGWQNLLQPIYIHLFACIYFIY